MNSSQIHEDVLRHLWSRQYLDVQRLVTLDGAKLSVLEPGELNRGSGPDFRNAVIVIDRKTYRGDVEFHRSAEDWKVHSHHDDANYNSVILHVVLHESTRGSITTSASGRLIPVLILDRFLSSPLETILEHVMRDEHLSRSRPIRCYQRNDTVTADVISTWLHELSLRRLEEKSELMHRRLRQIIEEQQKEKGSLRRPEAEEDDRLRPYAWEQLLYEGIMDGLGYSKNRRQFRELARRFSVRQLGIIRQRQDLSVLEIQAILFHVAGLLQGNDVSSDQASKVYLHRLRSAWADVSGPINSSDSGSIQTMDAIEWIFSPSRPSNFPTARIAAASHLLSKIVDRSLYTQLIGILSDQSFSASRALEEFTVALSLEEDPFWSFHYSFKESSPRPHSLLGVDRVRAIIVNTVIPITFLYGKIVIAAGIQERAKEIASIIPPQEGNAITRKIERQLLKGKLPLHLASQQQGIIQLYTRYCVSERCGECEVGKRVFV